MRVTLASSVRHRSLVAIDLCDDGDVDGAIQTLGELWPRPQVETEDVVQAELLLALGTVKTWAAIEGNGSHEEAKDDLTAAERLFGDDPRRYQCRARLAVCYVRQDAVAEAGMVAREVMQESSDTHASVIAGITQAFVEIKAGRYSDALATLNSIQPFIESERPTFKGKFHNHRAIALKNMGQADRAMLEYEAALYWFEVAGNKRFEAAVLNNMAPVFDDCGKHDKAMELACRAERIYEELKDRAHLGQVKDTIARLWYQRGKYSDALAKSNDAVTLADGDDKCWLASSLIRRGKIHAALKHEDRAKADFLRAVDEAELSGNLESAGDAYLTMIETLHLAVKERAEFYRRADRHSVDANRLRLCARTIIGDIHPPRSKSDQDEHDRIVYALTTESGNVEKAARLLGLSGPGLAKKIDRDPSLIKLRAPKRIRRTRIIKK